MTKICGNVGETSVWHRKVVRPCAVDSPFASSFNMFLCLSYIFVLSICDLSTRRDSHELYRKKRKVVSAMRRCSVLQNIHLFFHFHTIFCVRSYNERSIYCLALSCIQRYARKMNCGAILLNCNQCETE
jgi:hypothetical protein